MGKRHGKGGEWGHVLLNGMLKVPECSTRGFVLEKPLQLGSSIDSVNSATSGRYIAYKATMINTIYQGSQYKHTLYVCNTQERLKAIIPFSDIKVLIQLVLPFSTSSPFIYRPNFQ